jgi:hypothetical protein
VATRRGAWRLTVRAGSQVERARVDSLEEALFAARKHVVELEPSARREPARAFLREVAPDEQVAARIELRGPRRRRGGVDLRGDGSLAAWTGLVRKSVVEPERGEDALGALGRALGG